MRPTASATATSGLPRSHAVGARPHRLSPPAGAGDWNDYLRAVGLASMRAELEQAVGAVDSGPACACEG